VIPDTLLDALRQLPNYPLDLKSIGAPLVEDGEAYFNDPYTPPDWWIELDPNDLPVKGWRVSARPLQPDWWIEQDRRGVRECVRDYGDCIEQTIAERLAGGEIAPFWRLVHWLEKAYEDTGIDVEGIATLALARFLARTRPGTDYRERYLPLYSYVLDRWASRTASM
jgi:hypothetical protein